MATLLEKYQNRLKVSESLYSRTHEGQQMSSYKKTIIAKCLENTNKFLTEALNSTMATQRADMGDYKKFCLNLVTLALPNSIAEDLVIVQPMSSFAGNLAYLEYVAGTEKGEVESGELFNSVWSHGEMTDGRMKYTGDRVVEKFDSVGATEDFVLGWGPAAGKVEAFINSAWTEINDTLLVKDANGKIVGIKKDAFADGTRVRYIYDNVIIPQEKLPTLKAQLKNIPLQARARRIAVNSYAA